MQPQQKSVSNGGGNFKIIQPSRIAIMPEYDNSFDANDNEKFKTLSQREDTAGFPTEYNNRDMNTNQDLGHHGSNLVQKLAIHQTINDDYDSQINKRRIPSNRFSEMGGVNNLLSSKALNEDSSGSYREELMR